MLLDRTESYRSPAVHERVMDVDGVVVDWYRSGVCPLSRSTTIINRNNLFFILDEVRS